MDSLIATSAKTKPEHGLRNAYSNAFSTKLSLPKFITVAKLLTLEQRSMVESIGFHSLLDIRCESVPRGICVWLAKHFDVKSRSLQLPDGSKLSITSESIHQVLGIPNGGTPIGKKYDETVKKLIADETRCKGKTPTINELKSLFTPDLLGDKFKRIFTLFALGSFLCPTSYDCISPDYYSAMQSADLISSYDWCSAVLDKLTQSIEFYQRTSTTTSTTSLGGCILALVIIYFELLDIPSHTSHEVVPRLKFWSTDIIKAFETLDAKDVDECIFGKLPIKNIREMAPFSSATTSKVPGGYSKCIPGSCIFKTDFASLSQDIANEITKSIQPILSQYFDRMHAACHCPPEAARQDSLVAEQKILFDRGKARLELEFLDTHITERIPQHLVSSTLVKDSDMIEGKSDLVGTVNIPCEPSDDHATKGKCTIIEEQSMQHDIQANTEEDKSLVKLEKTVEERSLSRGHDTVSDNTTSSFLHLPSFSQATMSDSSSLEQDTTELKPCISKNGEGIEPVLASHQCSDTKSSEIVDAVADQNGDSSTCSDYPHPLQLRTLKKSTAGQEFDFWCHGLGSDFEVNPQTQVGFTPNPDETLSNSSSRKRPRTLNEAALDLYSMRRLHEVSTTTHSTHQISGTVDQGSTQGENLLQANFDEIDDADLMDHLNESMPCNPLKHHIDFTSTLVEKEVFIDIIARIPFHGPRPRVVEIKKNWVDHKTFGLSMRVYGTVSSYVIDVMGKAVMTEEYERNKANLLPSGFWYRHVVQIDKAKLLQQQDANAQDLSKFFIEPNQGYRLDIMDLIFIPVFYDHFWYLVVANFRIRRFEVLIPNQLFEAVKTDAETIILNFKRIFNYACPHSTKVRIWQMETAYRSVTWSKNHCDSGIFVMKLIQSHDGESQHLFKPEEAKTLRECLTYYLLTHPSNEKFDSLIDIEKILSIHGISRNSYY